LTRTPSDCFLAILPTGLVMEIGQPFIINRYDAKGCVCEIKRQQKN